MISFLTESTKDFKDTETIGSFTHGSDKNSFDDIYTRACLEMQAGGIDPMLDIDTMVKSKMGVMESFKDKLLEKLEADCEKYKDLDECGRYATLYEQTAAQIDNCIEDFVKESTRVGQLLPIKAVDIPIIIKSNLALASKDIIQTEVTKQPIIKKHIERRWIVDTKTNKRWEYPQCFFKDDFKEIFSAGKGLPISPKPVDISSGVFGYKVIDNLTKAVDPTRENFTIDLKIVRAGTEDYPITATTDDDGNVTIEGGIPIDMRINVADGTWLGGQVKDPETGEVIDIITGTADFVTNTVNLSACNGKVKNVSFQGYLSNEWNERQVTFDRTREEFEWKIEDGFRADVPYSLEELEDAKALMNIDLYKETFNDLSDLLIQMEDSKILEYLDMKYDEYKGVELDTLGFDPFIREQVFDCDAKTQTCALPSQYIQEMLKFYVDRFIIDICDTAKIEDMTFVCYGNPRYISLLDPSVNWVVKSGDSVGGVKANYSYGIMNSGGCKIQVVSTTKYPASDSRKLRFIPYPIDDKQYTFKHYKYTSHILTAQNSAYRSPDRPGGSMTYLMGTTRNVTTSIQAIQASMSFENTPFILEDKSKNVPVVTQPPAGGGGGGGDTPPGD